MGDRGEISMAGFQFCDSCGKVMDAERFDVVIARGKQRVFDVLLCEGCAGSLKEELRTRRNAVTPALPAILDEFVK